MYYDYPIYVGYRICIDDDLMYRMYVRNPSGICETRLNYFYY